MNDIEQQIEAGVKLGDPAAQTVHAWIQEQRLPLSDEQLERICLAAHRGAMRYTQTAVSAQLRKVITLEMIVFGFGVIVGYLFT